MARKKQRRRKKLAKLTPEEDRAWTFAFLYYKDKGLSDLEADEKAWKAIQEEFPRLRKYEGALL